MESAVRQAKEYEQAVLSAEARLRDSSRQVLDLEHKCEELTRKCAAVEKARQQLQEQAAAAEVRGQQGGGAKGIVDASHLLPQSAAGHSMWHSSPPAACSKHEPCTWLLPCSQGQLLLRGVQLNWTLSC